jgi:hypothetical protein
MFFVVLAAVLGPLFLLCYLIDRRSRKRGHTTSVNERRARDGRSDARAINAVPNSAGHITWTDAQRNGR